MATNTERIDELTEIVRQLTTQVAVARNDVDGLKAQVAQLQKSDEELKATGNAVAVKQAVLERDVEDLKKTRETWGQRGWQIAVGVLLAVVGGVIGYLIKR